MGFFMLHVTLPQFAGHSGILLDCSEGYMTIIPPSPKEMGHPTLHKSTQGSMLGIRPWLDLGQMLQQEAEELQRRTGLMQEHVHEEYLLDLF